MSPSKVTNKFNRSRVPKETFEDYPFIEGVATYLSWGLLIIVGHISDFLIRIGLKKGHGVKNVR